MQKPPTTTDWYCSNCGTANNTLNLQCSRCGGPHPLMHIELPQGLQPTPQIPLKKRSNFRLLGIFLGFFGIHNFYAGYIGKGIAQLLLTVFGGYFCFPLAAVWIWAIVEAIIVDREKNGRPLA